MPFLSFYGTDGSGKSAIANELAVMIGESADPLVMGGSTYKEWLTPEIANHFMADEHTFEDVIDTEPKKTRLYEDIAIVCYGLANCLSQEGRLVLIDSDPFLKRIIWGTFTQAPDAGLAYAQSFCRRVDEYLPLEAAPDTIVGVNVSHECATTSEDLFRRILMRGGDSSYDPTDESEMRMLDSHVRRLWGDITIMPSSVNGVSELFGSRISRSKTLAYENPQCSLEELTPQIRRISAHIIEAAL